MIDLYEPTYYSNNMYPLTDEDKKDTQICALSDAIECTVERNTDGLYTLSLKYPYGGKGYNEIRPGRWIEAPVSKSKKECFKLTSVEKNTDGIMQIEADHISYNANYVWAKPFRSATPSAQPPIVGAEELLYEDYSSADRMCGDIYSACTDIDSGQVGDFDEIIKYDDYASDFRVNQCDYKDVVSMRQAMLDAIQGREIGLIADGFHMRFVDLTSKKNASKADHRLTIGKDIVSYNSIVNLDDFAKYAYFYMISTDEDGNEYFETGERPLRPFNIPIQLPKELECLHVKIKPINLRECYTGYAEREDRTVLDMSADRYINENPINVFRFPEEFDLTALPTQTEDYELGDTIDIFFQAVSKDKRSVITSLTYDALNEQYTNIGVEKVRKDITYTIAKLEKRG